MLGSGLFCRSGSLVFVVSLLGSKELVGLQEEPAGDKAIVGACSSFQKPIARAGRELKQHIIDNLGDVMEILAVGDVSDLGAEIFRGAALGLCRVGHAGLHRSESRGNRYLQARIARELVSAN